ncbi:MAG TPA: SLBB domain-containing protein, partial [Fervidobacterium sp.]|nr:SLBB domain-containing protein [Fervidobacterium sp.]
VQLTYKEPRTLSYLIKKLGILQPESIEKVLLIRDGKQQEYAINQLLYDQISVPLAKYDTVILKQAETNAVYLTGDVAAYVTFAYNEPITMQRVLAKVGLSDLRKIEKITNGDTSIDFTKDLAIQKGAILNVQLKKPIYVTAMGYIKNTGRVSFDYYETADLQTLFAKLGGLIISPDAYYTSDKVFIIEDGKVTEQYDAQKIFKGLENAPLRDGNFVYVTESTPKQVYVFGKGMQNGLVRFTQSEDFDLRTLIGKLGGIKEGTSKTITIIDTESTNTTIQWDEYANIPLKTNSMVLFDIDTRNFIYVVDPSGKPNMIYTDRSISLYEVLTKVGINKNYNKVELTSGTNKQTITLKSVSDATGYNVKPGDIVKISDASMNFIYVLGEVKNPGIIQVTEGMTVLQAVIQSGYFTAKAVPSTVWLYKGGVDGQAVKVNLSAAVGGGKIDFNPIVEPGDIVFVPTDMFKTAIEWVGTVASLVEMFNTIYGLFN